MRPWILPFAAGALVVALVATSVTSVVQTRRAAAAEDRAAELAQEVSELRAQVRALETELDEARTEAGLLGDLLGDDLAGLLEDLGAGGLGGLLGDGNPLDGLLGDGDAAGLLDGLLGGDGAGLLDGLLGGAGGDGGGLDALLGVGGGVPGAACLLGGQGDGGGGLGGLLDGLTGGGSDPAPDDPDELVAAISGHVAELRELDWREPVEGEFLDDAQLRARLDELLAEDHDPASVEAEARLLTALGALPPGLDLAEVQRELLDEQVAGFYVPDTGELVVRVPDDGTIRPIDRVTLAHELDHALTDQVLGLPQLDGPPFDEDPDAALGALAMVEGDATLLMQQWAAAHLSMGDQLSFAFSDDAAAAQASLDDVPAYLQRELLFPYVAGLDWVCDRWLEEGWSGIDAAYDELPTTSHEVLFGAPVEVTEPTPTTGPPGWELVRDAPFGAAPLLWLFEAPGGDEDRALDDALARVAPWGGGQARVWADGADTAVTLSLTDAGSGSGAGAATGAATGAGLCASVEDWYRASFPDAVTLPGADGATTWRDDDRAAVLRCPDDEVHLAVAPDLPTATTMGPR
jgi:hypothetical protein